MVLRRGDGPPERFPPPTIVRTNVGAAPTGAPLADGANAYSLGAMPPPIASSHRVRAMRRPVVLALLAASALGALADAGDRKPAAPAPVAPAPAEEPDLRTRPIPDLATSVSIPLSPDTSFVVGIPGRLFIQCPRNSALPVSLEGDGLVLQDVFSMQTGNAHALVYVGSVPLPKPEPKEKFDDRLARGVRSFVEGLRAKYARVDVRLVTDPPGIELEKTTLPMDGKPVVAWRTSKYVTSPAGETNKPDALLSSEAVFLGDALSGSMTYVVVDAKGRTLALDRLLGGLSIRKTAVANPKGRLVPLNDVSSGLDGRYPIRLAWFTSPPGFAPTIATVRFPEDRVYAEERLDATGVVTGEYRIDHRDHGATTTLEGEVELERVARHVEKDVTPTRAVALAPGSGRAIVFAYARKVGTTNAWARSAVFEVDDKIWTFTLTTYGDEPLAKADTAAFDALLAGLHLAVR